MNHSQLWSQVNKILWNDWDPIGINDYGRPNDEYRGYVSSIVKLLIDNSEKLKITKLLHKYANSDMGLYSKLENHIEVAIKLKKINLIRENKRLELINTIEISPFNYTNSDYDFPNGSSEDLPEEWNKFWKTCLSDSNLGNLEAIKKGSYLVDITKIKNSELEEILKKELEDVDLTDFKEQISCICGGIAIKIENNFVIEPTCCGDLESIKEWGNIFIKETENWNQLWIGHPWIFYKNTNGIIEFSGYSEKNIEDLEDVKPILKISSNELENKLIIIKEQLIVFENRIQIILEKMGIKNSKQIAKLMTGNTN